MPRKNGKNFYMDLCTEEAAPTPNTFTRQGSPGYTIEEIQANNLTVEDMQDERIGDPANGKEQG